MGYAGNIFERLSTSKEKEGKVVIYQSEAIMKLIGTPSEIVEGATKHVKLKGYRILVFADNQQQSSKQEALRREEKVKELFPEMTTYLSFVSPFWKLRAGDFSTYDEANAMLHKMKSKLGEEGKEMYIIKENIIIPLN